MPAFDRLNAIAGRAIDRQFGEAISIVGRLRSQYGPRSTDADRDEIATIGVFSDDPSTNDIAGQRAGNSLPGATRLGDGVASIQIMAADAALWPWEPKKGDSAILAGRSPARGYDIADVHRLDHGDVVLILAREHS